MSVRSSGSSRTGTAPIREEATFYWPQLANVADGGAWQTDAEAVGGTVRASIWGAVLGIGTTLMRFNTANTNRMMAGEFINAMRWLAIGCRNMDDSVNIPGGMFPRPFYTVFEFAWAMRSRVVLPSFDMAVQMLATSGTTPDENPQAGFTRPGFGVRGNGATFVWESWGNGALMEAVPLTQVPDPTKWHDYSIEIIAAKNARPCTVTLRVDGAVAVARNMDNAKIPIVNNGLATGTMWLPSVRNKTAGGAELLIANLMLRYSRFGRDGRDYSV